MRPPEVPNEVVEASGPGRDGGEKGRPLGERRAEHKEKREERDKHNQDERAAEGNSSVPEW